MAKIDDILSKKVAGIKVLYLALVFVGVLGFFAWKSVRDDDIDTGAEGDVEVAGDEELRDTMPEMSSGTVYVTTPPADVEGDLEIETNESWAAKSIAFLSESNAVTAIEAQIAIQKYLAGADLSWSQGQLVDKAIGRFGTPPTLNNVGTIGKKPGEVETPATKPESKKKPATPPRPRVATQQKNGINVRIPSPVPNADGYIYYVSRKPDFSDGYTTRKKGTFANLSVQSAGTKYYVAVAAYNSAGESGKSPSASITTKK